MIDLTIMIAGGVAIAAIFFVIGWSIKSAKVKDFVAEAKEQADRIMQNANLEAESLKKEKMVEGQDEIYQLRQKSDEEVRSQKKELNEYEKKLSEKEIELDSRQDNLQKNERLTNEKQRLVEDKERQLSFKENRLDKLIDEQNSKLENIAGMTREEAKQRLMDNLVEDVKKEAAQTLYDIREEARKNANQAAKEIMVSAIQESAVDHAVETTVSIIKLPNDDMKGRIIGREGRNIRAFELNTGIDIIVDDTPEIVILSGFDPVRREVAKLSLEKLIADGRIHPSRIEDVVARAWEEMDEHILHTGEEMLLELSLATLPTEIIKLIGKMKYFTSYGQNLLQHSKEVAKLAALMATELELDSGLAKRAGLLHSIGKVMQGRLDDNHVEIGKELLRKHNFNPVVIDAVSHYKENDKPMSLIGALVNAAVTISCSRPGARKDSLESFIKRLQKLEAIAMDFDGVHKVHAIQAGREIRIMVDFEKINDQRVQQMAKDIAAKLEKELDYPGQIKVMIIREFRASGIAK
jgi:ribonuclease Y